MATSQRVLSRRIRCYTDKTCLRNALVFALGQELGRWSPRTRFVELIIDGDYRGLYMIWEA